MGKGEGEVLSDGWGGSIRRKNIRYTKTRGFVSSITQSHWGFEGALKKPKELLGIKNTLLFRDFLW